MVIVEERTAMTNDIGTCSGCGGKVLRVIYGYPILDDSVEVGVNVLLGGCCITGTRPLRRCADCGAGFDWIGLGRD